LTRPDATSRLAGNFIDESQGAIVRLEPTSEQRHEIELQAKRLERSSEDKKLAILKDELRAKLQQLRQQSFNNQAN
jgi:hypothetical protein